MLVEFGPIPSDCVHAWIAYGREVVDDLRSDPGDVPPRALDRFTTYLDEWSALAERGDPFRWSGQLSEELLEYLVNALYRTEQRAGSEVVAGRRRTLPPQAEKFNTMLVRTLLDALAASGREPARWVEQLRHEWGPAAGRD